MQNNIKDTITDNLSDIEKKNVLLKIFQEDIEAFAKFFFKNHANLAIPRFHKEVYALYEDKSIERLAIAAPRGHAKSTITDLIYLAWEICNKRQKFVLLVSDTYSQSVLFLEGLKAEFESNETLRAFYGDFVSDNWSEGEIIANGIMVKAIGAGMKVRGLKYRESRPTLIIGDDMENDEMVESKERRAKLERWINGALIPAMAKGGRFIIIGTILHYDSLLSKMISEDKYTEYTKKIYRAITDGESLWPEHLTIQDLEQIKADYISKGQVFLFYQEYQNDPVSDENRKFKQENFVFYDESQLIGKALNTYIAIDRAYSKAKTADATGIAVVSVDRDNNWYVRLAERFKGTEQEIINKIFDLKAYFNPIKIGIEQKAFEYTIKPTLEFEMKKRNNFFLVEQLKDLGRKKNIRIEGLVPRFETRSIFLQKNQIDLIDELVRFPKATHDDLCLVGETLIMTERGSIPIMNIVVGEKVLTRNGYKKVTASSFTGIREVITNLGITGTPDHQVITKNGKKSLQYVNESDTIYIWKEKQSSIKGKNTTGIQNQKEGLIESITGDMINGKNLQFHYTDKSGLITLVKYLKTLTSTIKTKILLIMSQIILNVFQGLNMQKFTAINQNELKNQEEQLNLQLKKQKSGMEVEQDLNGINNTHRKVSLVQKIQGYVLNVMKSIKQKLRWLQNTAQTNVVQDVVLESLGKKIQTTTLRRVYNITVEDNHEYFANGVLVANCDALSYMLEMSAAAFSAKTEFSVKEYTPTSKYDGTIMPNRVNKNSIMPTPEELAKM